MRVRNTRKFSVATSQKKGANYQDARAVTLKIAIEDNKRREATLRRLEKLKTVTQIWMKYRTRFPSFFFLLVEDLLFRLFIAMSFVPLRAQLYHEGSDGYDSVTSKQTLSEKWL